MIIKNKVKNEKTPNSILIYGLNSSEIDDEVVSDPTIVELVFEEFAWLVLIKPVYL